MFDRKLLLRVMLWSLGIAAVTGVLAILTGGEEVIGRVTGTALVTAVACLLMLAAAKLVDNQSSRPAGLLAMVAILTEFLLAVVVTWGVDSIWLPDRYQENLFFTLLCVAWAAIPAVGVMKLGANATHSVAARVGLGLCGAYLGASLVALWLPGRFWNYEELWGTAVLLFLAMPVFVVMLLGVGVEPGRHWRWVGVVSGIAACAMGLWGIWTKPDSDETVFICVTSVPLVVALANIAVRCPLKPGQSWLRIATIAAIIVTAAIVDIAVIIDPTSAFEDLFIRLGGATGILASCGLLALAILGRLNRQVDYEPLTGRIVEMSIHCPRCSKKQTIAVGAAACCDCGLRIHTRIEEPLCPGCGYLLYRLESKNCPECGTDLATNGATAGGGHQPEGSAGVSPTNSPARR